MTELKRGINVAIPAREYLAIQKLAARRKTSLSAILREWIQPHVEELMEENRRDRNAADS